MAKKASARKPKALTWPNGRKVAVSVTVMFETWPEDSAPNYSVQTTHLKKGTVDHAAKAWSTYGGRVGVWRWIPCANGVFLIVLVYPNLAAWAWRSPATSITRDGCGPLCYACSWISRQFCHHH